MIGVLGWHEGREDANDYYGMGEGRVGWDMVRLFSRF